MMICLMLDFQPEWCTSGRRLLTRVLADFLKRRERGSDESDDSDETTGSDESTGSDGQYW